ncbi:cupin domain-containing protein [Pseudophaeobacter sp.]|uniref:cupin domain-containing protein n=1 Tax=Pseudophaeobacter sp. TaxID=1971739 RepID=UPI003296F3BB
MCTATGTATPIEHILNARVRVTQWHFVKSGDNTGWHQHEYDYVVVPLFTGVLEIANEDGSRSLAQMQEGVPYFRKAGVRHDVINGNDFPCAFVETELLENSCA